MHNMLLSNALINTLTYSVKEELITITKINAVKN